MVNAIVYKTIYAVRIRLLCLESIQAYLSWLEGATDNRDVGGSIPPVCTKTARMAVVPV